MLLLQTQVSAIPNILLSLKICVQINEISIYYKTFGVDGAIRPNGVI